MRFSFEQLESRRLLATITLEGTTLTVLGTHLDDQMVVSIEGEELTFSGSDIRVPVADVSDLKVTLLGGHDTFTNDTYLPAVIDGGYGDDHLLGGSGDDRLIGGSGADRLEGREGSDWLSGGGETTDYLSGGDGIDRIVGVTASVTIGTTLQVRGTAASDEIKISKEGSTIVIDGAETNNIWDSGSVSSIYVYLGNGDDRFDSTANISVTVDGAEGNDILDGDLKTVLNGGSGKNQLLGSSEINYVSWSGINLVLHGTDDDDRVLIRQEANELYLAGMDHRWPLPRRIDLRGQGGRDLLVNQSNVPADIYGGDGDDFIYATVASAAIYGEAGNDFLLGKAADNIFYDGAGSDRILGGTGSDYYFFAAGNPGEKDIVYASSGNSASEFDSFYLGSIPSGVSATITPYGGTINHEHRKIIIPGDSIRRLMGSGGNDLIRVQTPRFRSDRGASDAPVVNNGFGMYLQIYGAGGNDQLSMIGAGDGYLSGGSGDDILRGGDGTNVISGEDGRDIIYGGSLGDYVDGGTDDDKIFGMGGDDNLFGHDGKDYLDGGEGNDKLYGSGFYARCSVTEYMHESSPNILLGGPGDDFLRGSNGRDSFSGGIGIDTILGEGEEDTLLDDSYLDGDSLDSIELFPPVVDP